VSHHKPTNRWEFDANYYRLSYQLLATEVNREQNSRTSQTPPMSTSATREELEDARIPDARALSKQIDSVLAYFHERQQESRFRFWRALSPDEQRLRRFLAETIEPGARLLAMREQGTLASLPTIPALFSGELHDRRLGPGPVTPRRTIVNWTRFTRSRRETQIRWSYRAFYSLACAYAVRNDPPRKRDLKLAVSALEEAFRLAHGQSRTSMLAWAKVDPTLACLREVKTKRTLDEVLDKYAQETTEPSAEKPAPATSPVTSAPLGDDGF
jgi:hypothetical protein